MGTADADDIEVGVDGAVDDVSLLFLGDFATF